MSATDDDVRWWVQREQACLWTDLTEAIERAQNRAWSIDCADVVQRILSAARLLGPVTYGVAPWPAIGGGLFTAVYDVAGITTNAPTGQDLVDVEAVMVATGGADVAECRDRYAATVLVLTTDEAERRFLLDVDG